MATNSSQPDLGHAQLSALSWLEPAFVVATMIAALIFNRRKSNNIISDSSSESEEALIDKDEYDSDSSTSSSSRRPPYPIAVFNRILNKFPFLVEMFYWVLNYAAYRLSKRGAALLWGRTKGTAVVELAQNHGISLLTVEHESFLKPFFFISEVSVQQFFLKNHLNLMSILNQIYSLVHIPGTVAYVSLPAFQVESILTSPTASSPGTTTPLPTTQPSP